MGYFIVEAPATAQDGVFVRGVHHSDLGFNVRGAGAAYAGIEVKFAVCTTFDRPTVSVNEGGWYLGAAPAIGLSLLQRNPGETVSYCSFNNPIIEGPAIGIQMTGTLGNSFFGEGDGHGGRCTQPDDGGFPHYRIRFSRGRGDGAFFKSNRRRCNPCGGNAQGRGHESLILDPRTCPP